ncbi:TetR/AcrR family transcriptional regulator [Flaviaesturariibacter terrae]
MAADQKQTQIIEAAIRRFADAGVAKTTMNEIAADLAISKALLYYYFPDKISLYAAVLGQIAAQDSARNERELDGIADPLRALERYLDTRTDFILRYYQLLEYLKAFSPATLPEPLRPIFAVLRQRQLDRITSIMEKGRASGVFKMPDARKTAELYFDFLDGFRHAVLARQPNSFPDKKQFGSLLKREKEFSRIFMNGLSCHG